MDVNTQNWFQAAATGDIATLRAMIVAGVDIDTRDDLERTAFHLASQHKQTDVMTTILAARQMKFLKHIGFDPLAVPAPAADNIARTGTF